MKMKKDKKGKNSRCAKCSKPAKVNLKTSGDYCNSCFLKVIEKRVRKDMRLNKWIEKNDKILFVDDNSKEAKVGDYLLKSIIKGLPVKITKRKSASNASKYDKIILPWSLDMEVEEKLGLIFSKIPKIPKKQQQKKMKEEKKEIRLLRGLLDKEIEIFAKLKKFKCKKGSKSKLQKMVDKLEERYPGCKFSVLNSMKLLNS